MATTVKDVLSNLKKVNIQSLTAVVIKENTKEIIEVNQKELREGKNFVGQTVGLYAKSTELISKESPTPNQPKIAGQPYNFDWSGNLLEREFITYRNATIKFDSRGKGDNQKQLFVTINRLLGVDENGEKIINFKIILPDLQKKFKQITKL
jgi:hypothetical protein